MAAPNWTNQTMWTGDNLPIMRGMNSESVDLIYLDPPFNSNANYAAPIGSKAAGAEFKDTWTLQDVDVAWLDLIQLKHPRLNRVIDAAMTDSDKSYLIYMAPRLLEMHRILKPTGSIYLHCDPKMSHYLKLLMDSIWGRKNFRREVIWHLRGASGYKALANDWIRGHDTILYYTCGTSRTFNKQWLPYDEKQLRRFSSVDEAGRQYKPITKTRRLYLDEAKGVPVTTVWSDIASFQTVVNAKEATGYPTQKPLALLARIIKASSNEGDMVLDPFAGCATACVASNMLTRQWVGIDISPVAFDLVRRRIEDGGGLFYDIRQRTDVPEREDLGKVPAYNCKANRERLYGMQGGHCAGCGHHFLPRNLTVDHIIAQNVGGTDHLSNLQLLCGACNSTKGDRGMEYLLAQLNGVATAFPATQTATA